VNGDFTLPEYGSVMPSPSYGPTYSPVPRKLPVAPMINALIAEARARRDNALSAFDQSDAMPAIEAAIKAASDRSEAARVSLAKAQERLSSPVPAMPEQVEFNTGDTLAIGLSGLFGGMQGAMKASSPVAKLAAERQARVYQNNLARWQQQQGLAEREYGRSAEDIRAEKQLLATIEGEGRQYGRDRAYQRLQLGLAGDAQIMDLEKIGLGHKYDLENLGRTQDFAREQTATDQSNRVALANLQVELNKKVATWESGLRDGQLNSAAKRERFDKIKATLAVADDPAIVDALAAEVASDYKTPLPADVVEGYRTAAAARKRQAELVTGASVYRASMAGAPKPKFDDFGAPRGGLGGALPPAGGGAFDGTNIVPMSVPSPPIRFERPEQVWDSLDPASRDKYAPLIGSLRGLSGQKEAILRAEAPKGEKDLDKKERMSKTRSAIAAIDKEIRTTREKLEASLSPEFKSARREVATKFLDAIKELSKKTKGRSQSDAAQYLEAQRTIRDSFRNSFGVDIDRVIQ